MSYLDLTIAEIHEAFVAKKVTPLDLTKEAIARAKANPDNAFELIWKSKRWRKLQP
jgi:Asp-tRNA(Asn)/Glu-tRNA(Gln) amidotransferase A subunit family amidase